VDEKVLTVNGRFRCNLHKGVAPVCKGCGEGAHVPSEGRVTKDLVSFDLDRLEKLFFACENVPLQIDIPETVLGSFRNLDLDSNPLRVTQVNFGL
jgi:hypothetical protein